MIADEPTSRLDADLIGRTAGHLADPATASSRRAAPPVRAECRPEVPALHPQDDGGVRCVLHAGVQQGVG